MLSFKEFLINCKNGKIENYTKNKITYAQKSLLNLQNNSSDKYKFDFDLYNLTEDDYNLLMDMISKFEFKVVNEYGVYNNSIFKDTANGICELCGKNGCKHLYKIVNIDTNKKLYVGSQCIKKFNLDCYINEDKVDVDEALNMAENIYSNVDKIKNSEYGKLFMYCHNNNEIILENNPAYRNFYDENIDSYGETVFSGIYCLENNQPISDSIYKEIENYHFKMYRWSSNLNKNEGIITFVPNLIMVVNNTLKYDAKYKVILNGLSADYYNNKKLNKKNFLYLNARNVYDNIKNINSIYPYTLLNSTDFIKARIIDSKPKAFDIIALILSLPNNYEDSKEIIQNYFKFRRETQTGLTIKVLCENYIKTFNKIAVEKEDNSDFGNFIKLIYNAFNEVFEEFIKERNTKIESKKNTVKKTKRHHKNNLI